MSPDSPLERLCRRYRITSAAGGVNAARNPLSRSARRALLAALGVAAADEEAAREALNRVEAADWRRVLPPVQVVWEDEESGAVPLSLAADRVGHRYLWEVVTEGGATHSDEFLPRDLESAGERRFGEDLWQRRLLRLPAVAGTGYHRLLLRDLEMPDEPAAQMTLVVAPRTCYQPEALRVGGRVWGPSLDLYALRSARNWGVGDFSDLQRALEFAADAGAGLVGAGPLHALCHPEPGAAGPYGPSARGFLDVLYLDVEAIADFAECAEAREAVADEAFQAGLRALRAGELVDYPGVARAKMAILEMLHRHFRRHHLEPDTERARAFHRYRQEQGETLRRHALYQALQQWLHSHDRAVRGWTTWPQAYQDVNAEAVSAFAREQAQRVELYEYLQWQAELQLEAAGQRSFELGLDVGLYLDFAVGVDGDGAEVWAERELFANQAHLGAPPDELHPAGRDRGMTPWHPERLRERAYAPFIDLLRRNMRVAGALRIDQVMALARPYWMPRERAPREGGYVGYPLRELLGILALESRRNSCLVIGEDLDAAPLQVREAVSALGVLSCPLFYSAKTGDGGFMAPGHFESRAVVAVSNRDMPPLAGYWQGRDLQLRERLGLFPDPETRERQLIARAEDRVRLLVALEREGLLPAGMSVQAVSVPEMTPELAEAVHVYLARSPATIMAVRLEDVWGQMEPANLPGSGAEHPNWRRKLSLDLELWGEDSRVRSLVGALRTERGRVSRPPLPHSDARPPPPRAVIPSSTYRLQLHREFTFDQAVELVPYLHRLGISHCYASPYLQARPGSAHGYDIIDHGSLNRELGGEAGFGRFVAALRDHDMGQIMDMVPNHMGVMGSDNAWWLDVLENGQSSVYASFFDIDWAPLAEPLRGKLLVPVLGDHYGSVLDRGELELSFDSAKGAFSVRYYEHEFPVDPREYPRILGHDMGRLEERLGREAPRLLELQSLITAFGNLPHRDHTGKAAVAERARDKEVHKAALARLYDDADIACFLDENLRSFNARAGVEPLHELLERQAWRLAYWRVASDEINYRRFFDINELAGLRMEVAEVFEATHGLLLELIAKGDVQGVRIDHPDGLYDPTGYFDHLQSRVRAPLPTAAAENGGAIHDAAATADQPLPLYLLVEKILAGHERLRPEWAVHGTTGYDFANRVNGLFVDPSAEQEMDRAYREVAGEVVRLEEQICRCKRLIMRTALASELNVLAQQLTRIAGLDRHTRDFTLNSLREALSEIVACFPVYRTYVGAEGADEEDRRYVDWAVNVARKRSRAADISVFAFVRDVLLTDIAEGRSEAYREQVTALAMKFQQYTGPVMAKGLEDTAFYRCNRLVSLDEVAGDPDRFGVSVAAFHQQNLERARNWPHAMLSTSTHDSKRSEDVRARIDVLSELSAEWRRRVQGWVRLNRSRKRLVEGGPAPSGNDEYLLYQTLVGAWPLDLGEPASNDPRLAEFCERIESYMLKAVKEAKQHTSWINPDAQYEEAVSGFVQALFADPDKNPFLADFIPFMQRVSRIGLYNSLAQSLLKLTSPGVPDTYQGNELWDFSLVDPDNRRAVDYGRRQTLLAQLQAASEGSGARTELARELIENLEDGRAKLFLTWRALLLRREWPDLFREGDYLPLTASGPGAERLCAFARRHGKRMAVTVTPRLVSRLADGTPPLGDAVWADTRIELPGAVWVDQFTGERLAAEAVGESWRLPVAAVLRHFPVALLASADA